MENNITSSSPAQPLCEESVFSGIGVLDKSVLVMRVLRDGPANLGELTQRTGIPRATTHRIAQALVSHRLVAKDSEGRFLLGPGLRELASAISDPLVKAAQRAIPALRDEVGESVQLYVREGSHRICVVAAEPSYGLRDSVPVGVKLPLTAGSGAQILVAWDNTTHRDRALRNASFPSDTLDKVRSRHWAHSIGEREPGVASVSVPIKDPHNGAVHAALCVSGPTDRIAVRTPQQWAQLLAPTQQTLELIGFTSP